MSYHPAKSEIYRRAVEQLAQSLGRRPTLYDGGGRPVAWDGFAYRKTGARHTGSMKNWRPTQIDGGTAAVERETIVNRVADLVGSDPHGSGVVDTFATTVVGPGLTPFPALDRRALGLARDQARDITNAQRAAFATWAPWADANERMDFAGIQTLWERNLIQHGESFTLARMIDDPARPFFLALHVVHPLRVKTPVDRRSDPNIRDGIELSGGRPIAVWIKKPEPGTGRRRPDTSSNFHRVVVRSGHRWRVLHDFVVKDAGQVRGESFFQPALKFFRDLNDYLDAELVSNIVTAAFSLFIETKDGDPTDLVESLAFSTTTETSADGTQKKRYHEEFTPGAILYGNEGEKPHAIKGDRPGATFVPFTRLILKALATAVGVPYPVLFRDVDGVSYAGFRSAMLEAWRVFNYHRQRLARGNCQRVYTMLMEEAYLRGYWWAPDFYGRRDLLTKADWRGYPKGDIEPAKLAKADSEEIAQKLKSRQQASAERGRDFFQTLDEIDEENDALAERGLVEQDPAHENDGAQAAALADTVADAVADELEARRGIQ